jgi:hypothetical protein
MKNTIMSVMAALAVFASAPKAEANIVDNWSCRLDGEISGLRLGFGLGGQYLNGFGMINCVQANDPSVMARQPVELTVLGGGASTFDFTVVESMRIVTAGIGRVGSPESFLGQYGVQASASANLIARGVGANAAVKVTNDYGFGFEMGFQGEKAWGIGARLHGLVFVIDGNGDVEYSHDGGHSYEK